MTITLRLTKGTPLTHGELDGNFSDLDARFPVATANIGDDQVTADKLADNAVLTAAVADANITFAKIQDASGASKLFGRGDSGAGDFEEITLGAGLTMTGTELSASGAGLPTDDATAIVQGSVDNTKRLRFEVDGFTAATTRVIAPADRNWSPTVFGEELAEVADAAAGRTKLALGTFATLSSLTVDGLSDAVITSVANNEVLAFDTTSGNWINQTAAEAGLSPVLTLSGTFTQRASGNISLAGGVDGDVLTVQADGSVAFEAANAHTHELVDITDAGDLAALDTVATAQIEAQAVTLDKIVDQAGFAAGTFSNPTVTVSQEGVITVIESGAASGGLSTVNDADTEVTLSDDLANTHRRLTAATAITVTLDPEASVGTKIAVTPKGDGVVTVQIGNSIPFDSGDVEPVAGETLTGGTSGASADVVEVRLTSGAWATNDAAGTIVVGPVTDGPFEAEALTGSTAAVLSATGAESPSNYKLPLDTAAQSTDFIVGGYVLFEAVANSDDVSAEWDVVGETNHPDQADNDLDLDGHVVSGNYIGIVTRGAGSTQPNASVNDSGKYITTDGAITIPNVLGWHCDLEIGADTHDITHNAIVLDISAEGFAAGEVYTVISKSTTAIRVIGPAGQFTEADFA